MPLGEEVKIRIGTVVLSVCTDNNSLSMVINEGPRCDLDIPNILPSGQKIDVIKGDIFRGKYGKITISNDIKQILACAFYEVDAEEVVWPDTCGYIPFGCFQNSNIGTISNIDQVVVVGECAFRGAKIGDIIWPSKCKEMPAQCFSSCHIRALYNTEHIVLIGEGAFYKGKIKYFNWPQGCPVIPDYCFQGSDIETLSGINNIKTIGYSAFSEAYNLKELDLSSLQIISIDECAFGGLKKSVVSLPYYIMSDNAEQWFAKII